MHTFAQHGMKQGKRIVTVNKKRLWQRVLNRIHGIYELCFRFGGFKLFQNIT